MRITDRHVFPFFRRRLRYASDGHIADITYRIAGDRADILGWYGDTRYLRGKVMKEFESRMRRQGIRMLEGCTDLGPDGCVRHGFFPIAREVNLPLDHARWYRKRL